MATRGWNGMFSATEVKLGRSGACVALNASGLSWPAAFNGPSQDSQSGPQGPFRYNREDPGFPPRLVDVRPVVVRRHQGPLVDGLECVPVDVTDLGLDGAQDRPGDLAVRLQSGDGDGHVVPAHRVIAQRRTIHMNDEAVTDSGDRF